MNSNKIFESVVAGVQTPKIVFIHPSGSRSGGCTTMEMEVKRQSLYRYPIGPKLPSYKVRYSFQERLSYYLLRKYANKPIEFNSKFDRQLKRGGIFYDASKQTHVQLTAGFFQDIGTKLHKAYVNYLRKVYARQARINKTEERRQAIRRLIRTIGFNILPVDPLPIAPDYSVEDILEGNGSISFIDEPKVVYKKTTKKCDIYITETEIMNNHYRKTEIIIPQRDITLVAKLRNIISLFSALRTKGPLVNFVSNNKFSDYLIHKFATQCAHCSLSIENNDIELYKLEPEEATPQMDVGDTGEGTVGSDKAGNVVLTQAREESTVVTTQPRHNWVDFTSSDIKGCYSEMTDRWIKAKTFTWTTDNEVNSKLVTLELPNDVVNGKLYKACDMPNLIPFRVHRYVRLDMEVKIQVNSNKFQVGQLQCSWFYQPDLDSHFSLRDNIWSASQTHHVLVSAASSNEASMYIPFKWHLPMLSTRKSADSMGVLNMGKLFVRVLNPLSVVVGGPKQCNGTIFIRFLNCEFTGMISGELAMPQMDRVAVAALGALNTIVQAPNMDNPPVVRAPQYLVPTASHSWAHGRGNVEPLHMLRLDAKGQTNHPDRVLNEEDISYIIQKFGLVQTFKWSKNDTEGSILATFDACPMMDKSSYLNVPEDKDQATAYYLPPVAVISNLFNYWRGPLEFRFDIIASQFHTGRLIVGYVPGATATDQVTVNMLEASPHMVFTLQESQSFSFIVPYVANKPFWGRNYLGNYQSDRIPPPSRLYVGVINPLIPMQSVVDQIYINVYVRGTPEFEVAVPVQPSIGLSFNRTVLYDSTELVHANEGYSPYYVGNWRFTGNKAIMRYGTTSDHVAQFNTVFLNRMTIDAAKKVSDSSKRYVTYYYEIRDLDKAPKYKMSNGSMKALQYGLITWGDKNKTYSVMLCYADKASAAADAIMLYNKVTSDPGNFSSLINALVVSDTTSNTYSNGNPDIVVIGVSVPKPKPKVSSDDEYEVVVPQGNREESQNVISPGYTFESTNSGYKFYGESFNNVGDLCRRYQVYSSFVVQPQDFKTPGQCSYIIPVLPQGLELNLGTPKAIIELSNRCRDGHIPIICSGYRYARGSIRYRLVLPGSDIKCWVQHRPDRRLRQAVSIRCSNVETAESLANHTYASYIQDLHVNSIIEFEVPFYQNSAYLLLQRPIMTRTDESFYFSLGEISIGFQYAKADVKDLKDFVCSMYYSFADDMQLSTFQGYPPMILLDDISAPWTQEEAVPQGMFSDWFDKAKDGIKEEVKETVVTEIDAKVSEFADVMVNRLKQTQTAVESTKLSDIFSSSIVRNIFTNIAHVAANLNYKSIGIAIVSVLVEMGLVATSGMSSVIQLIVDILNSIKLKIVSESGNERKEPAIIEQAQEVAEFQMDTVAQEACLGIVTVIWSGLCSLLTIVKKPPTSISKLSTFITKDLTEVMKGSNVFFVFLRNILSVVDSMKQYLIGFVSPKYKIAQIFKEGYPELQAWAEEVVALTEPAYRSKNKFKQSYKNRVTYAHLLGQSYYRDIVKTENKLLVTPVVKLFERINEVKEEMTRCGEDSFLRKEPFVVWQCGQAGVGKSTIATEICIELLKHRGIKTDVPPIYNHEASSDFWDSCHGNPVMMVDDMFAIQTGEAFEKQLGLLFSVVSPVVLCPPKAHLDDKGKTYNPEIFWMNSNYDCLQFNGIHSDAIHRRRHIMFRTELSRKIKAGCLHCENKISVDEADPSLLADNHHLQFFLYEDKRKAGKVEYRDGKMMLTNLKGPYEYGPFLEILKSKFVEVATKNEEMFRRRLANVADLLEASGSEDDGFASIDERVAHIKSQVERAQRKLVRDSVLNNIRDFICETKVKCADAYKYAKGHLGIQSDLCDYLGKSSTKEVEAQPQNEGAYKVTLDNFTFSKALDVYIAGRKDDDFNYSYTFIPREDYYGLRRIWKESPANIDWVQWQQFFGMANVYGKSHNRDMNLSNLAKYLFSDNVMRIAFAVDMRVEHVKHFMCAHVEKDFAPENASIKDDGIYGDNGRIDMACNFKKRVGTEVIEEPRKCLWECNVFKFLWCKRFFVFNPQCAAKQRSQLVKVARTLPSILQPVDILGLPDEGIWKITCEKVKLLALDLIFGTYYTFKKFFSYFKMLLDFYQYMIGPILGIIILTTTLCSLRTTTVDVKVSSSKWSHAQPQAHGYQTPQNNINLNARTVYATPQAGDKCVEDVIERIRLNYFKITAQYGDNILTCTGVVLKGRRLLMLKHFIEELNACPADTIFYGKFPFTKFVEGVHGVCFDYRSCKKMFYEVQTSDGECASNIVVMDLPIRIPERKSIIHMIAREKDHLLARGDAVMIKNDGVIVDNLNLVREKHPLTIRAYNNSSKVVLLDKYAYRIQARGLCGSLVLCRGLERPIVGIHVAGIESGNVRGIAEILCAESFGDLPKTMPYEDVILPEMTDAEFSAINIDSMVHPYGCTDSSMTAHQGGNTQYIPSLIQGVFPVRTEPNPLRVGDPRLPRGCSPLRAGVEHLGKPPSPFPLQDIEVAKFDMNRMILANVHPVRPKVGVVSLQDAICGNANIPHFEPLEWSTSAGYPLRFTASRGKKGGKRWLFDLETGDNGYILKGINNELKEIMRIDHALRVRGIKPFTVFIDCLKDTCLPVEKCKVVGKTRIFSISPVQFTIQFKQYFLDFLAAYLRAGLKAENTIAIDVNSTQWTDLAIYWSAKGTKVIAGDYKNFGPSVMLEVAEKVGEIILNWYEEHGDGANNHIRRIMLYEIFCSFHLVQNLIYQTSCGIPSGSPITAPLNCMVNCMYVRVIWKRLTNLDFVSMHHHCNIAVLGDDIGINISDEISEIFNTQTMCEEFAKFNIVFTDSDKDMDIVKYRSLLDMTYLKCRFIPHPYRSGMWLAALDKVSVEGCANWVIKKNNLFSATIQNAEQCIMLAHGWGEEYYTEVCEKMRRALAEHKLECRYDSWRVLDYKRYGEVAQHQMCVPWSVRIESLTYDDWYDAQQVLNVLKSLRKLNFSLQEQRTNGLEIFDSLMECQVPFDQATRFPEHRRYICLGHNDWRHLFTRLRMVLVYKNGQENGNSSGKNAYNDACVSYYMYIDEMIAKIIQYDGILTRVQMEGHYGLSWEN